MVRVSSTVVTFYFVGNVRAEYLHWDKDAAPASVCMLNGRNCSSEDPVRPLEGIDCTGPHFDVRWDHFHHGLEAVRQMAEVPQLLVAIGEEMYLTHYDMINSHGTIFHRYLRGMASVEELEGFCAYGMVTVLYLITWLYENNVLKSRGYQDSEHWRNGIVGISDTILNPVPYLGEAVQGSGHYMYADFVADSRWAVFGSYQIFRSYERGGIIWPPPVPAPAKSFVDLSAEVPWIPVPLKLAPGRPKSTGGDLGKLHVSFFGVHASLLSEPLSLLQNMFGDTLHPGIFMRECPKGHTFHSHHCQLQCQLLGDCSGDGTHPLWSHFIRTLAGDLFNSDVFYYPIKDYLEILAQIRDATVLGNAELVVCTAPLTCSLLRAVVPKVPFLGYFGMAPQAYKNPQLDQLLVMHFVEMASNPQRSSFAVHNAFLQKLVEYTSQVLLPVVRPQSLYALPTSVGLNPMQYAASSQDGFYDPYFFSSLWPRDDSKGIMFRSKYLRFSWFTFVFEHFRRAALTRPMPFKLDVIMDNAVLNTYGKRSEDFISFDDLRSYAFAILFPWDPAPMCFFELYRLVVPLMVPSIEWITRIHRLTGWVYTEEIHDVVLAGMQNASDLQAANGHGFGSDRGPFWDHEQTVTVHQIDHWWRHADLANFPHVTYFESTPDLLRKIYSFERRGVLENIRQDMIDVNRRQLAESRNWFYQNLKTFKLLE